METFAASRARIARVVRENTAIRPTRITVITLHGTIAHAAAVPNGDWVISGERLGFEWHTASGYGENAYFDDEHVGWIRGHAPIGSKEEAALLAVQALG